jgi:hypothetical protein
MSQANCSLKNKCPCLSVFVRGLFVFLFFVFFACFAGKKITSQAERERGSGILAVLLIHAVCLLSPFMVYTGSWNMH